MGLALASAFVEVQMRLDRGSLDRAKGQVRTATAAMERDGKVALKTDNSKLRSGLNDAERSVESSARSMSSTFARYFTAGAFLLEMKQAITAATDLGESVNAVNVTFGDAAAGVHALGEESATSLGLSTAAFNALAVRFSAFASQIAGPGGDVAGVLDDMTTRAADFASVMNIDVAQAAELFQSGLAGESEPLRQYGIDLSAAAVEAHALEVGIIDGSRAMTEAEKVQARYSLLMQQTSKVQGDFANTSDSAANRQRILAAEFENAKAKLGTALLPVYGQAIGVLTELVEIFTSLPAPVQTGIVAMLGIVAVAGPVRDATRAFGGLSSVIGKLGKAGGPLLGLTVAVGAAALVVNSLGKEQRELEARSSEVGKALGTQWRETLRVVLQSEGAETAVAGLAAAQAALSSALTQAGEDGEKLTLALGTLGRQESEAADILIKFGRSTESAYIALLDLGVQAGLTAGQAATMARIVNGTDDEFEVAAQTAGALGEEFVGVALAMEEVQDQAEKTDLNAVATDALAAAAATSEQADNLIRLAEEQVGANRAGDQALAVYQRFNELLAESDQATQDAVLGLEEMAAAEEAVATSAGNAAGKFDIVTGAIDKSGGAAEAAAGKWDAFPGAIDKSGAAAADAETDFEGLADAASETTDEFDDLEEAANGLRTAIQRAINPALDLQAAEDQLRANVDALNTALTENGATLDAGTEAGRANRDQVRQNVQGFIDLAAVAVQNGESVESATDALFSNVDALKEQLRQAGFNETQINNLIDELNLMPEDKATVLRLVGEQAARDTITRYEGMIDQVPAEKRTEIEAAIRDGDIARVNAILDGIRDERVMIDVGASFQGINLPGLNIPGFTIFAQGGVVNRPTPGIFGEAGPEVIIPLSRPGRIQQLLADPRVAEPIAAAMGGGGADATGISGGITINGGVQVGSRDDLPRLTDVFADVLFDARHG